MSRSAWKETVGVAGAMVGAVIGAGFASGQEIVSFFAPLGSHAGLGLLCAALVLAVGGIGVVRSASSLNLADYGALFRASVGAGTGRVMDAIVTGFLFLTASVTLAGGAALLEECYGLPGICGLLVTGSVAAILVRRGHASFFSAGSWLGPLLILFLVIIAVASGQTGASMPLPMESASPVLVPPPEQGLPAAAASGLLYGSYNLVLGSGVLVAGGRYRARASALAGAAAAGTALGLLAFLVLHACVRGGAGVLEAQIPVAALAARLPAAGFHLFAVTLGLAGVTTLGAVATSLAERCRPKIGHFPAPPAPLFVALAIPVATMGFARLVRTVYPALGLLGLVWLGLWVAGPPMQE